MTQSLRAAALGAACALLAVGCGSARPGGASAPAAPGLSLATSIVTGTGSWAVLLLGGQAAKHNDFWQLLARPAGTRTWRLVTPPGVASNGGLAVAPAGGRSAVTGFLPSQGLSFSPLATTIDGGSRWSTGVLDAGLAHLPAALAAAPGTGRLLVLRADGTAELSAPGGTRWARLATLRSLSSAAAGQRCGLTGLTAASFGLSHAPVLAGTCTRRIAGVFTASGGTWRLAGPVLPASLGAPVRILAVAVAGDGGTVLLAAGTGQNVRLLAAWPHAGRWVLSRSLSLGGALVRSVSAGPAGAVAVVLGRRAGVTLAGPGASWQRLPSLPAATQALAPGPGARVDALAAAGTTVTDWAWMPGTPSWAKVQALHVPVQYGSSG